LVSAVNLKDRHYVFFVAAAIHIAVPLQEIAADKAFSGAPGSFSGR